MRSLLAILSLVLVAAILFAGCTGTSSEEQTTPAPTASPTASPTVAESPAPVSVASAITLGKMHAVMMEAIEEALAYPVLDDADEKKDFEAKVAEFDVLAVQFAEEAGLDQPGNAETKEAFDLILVKKGELVETANGFFAVYETDKVVKTENVTVLEESIDAFTTAFGPFTQNYFDRVDEAEAGDHATAALALLTMHRDIMEATEEAFGYVLLNDTVEKEEFWDTMQEFDAAGNAFVESGYLDKSENAAKLEAYTAMMHAKEQVQSAASAMFAEFEDTGAVSANVGGAFETEVDNLMAAFDTLLDEVLKDL
jgi:flagellar basal body rod protein FlgG